ncbi:hypothetical protein EDC01DRAFT_105417 [Geopyxis carbonaria]|nr:hypothetical protein EDC01DRAFT_105417 [Geopyxis carbonaria]
MYSLPELCLMFRSDHQPPKTGRTFEPIYHLTPTSKGTKTPTLTMEEPNPAIEDLPQISKEHRKLFQRMITMYHYRLLAAWGTFFRGESVPAYGRNPPCIYDWSLDKIKKAVKNFENHLGHYWQYTQKSVALCDPHTMPSRNSIIMMIQHAKKLIHDIPYEGEWSDSENLERCLDIVEFFLFVNKTRLWVDPGPGYVANGEIGL